jgi:hypothetical protein
MTGATPELSSEGQPSGAGPKCDFPTC